MNAAAIDLNCDLGERDDAPGIADDLALLELVTSANIACGGHAGDEQSMTRTVEAAMRRGVALGAHPGYADRANFGRAACDLPLRDLESSIAAQIAALRRIIDRAGGALTHVKAHGALYHAAMGRRDLADAIANAVAHAQAGGSAILVGQAGAPALDVWREMGRPVAAEAFADRRYNADGSLRSRHEADALITEPAEAAAQAVRIASGAGVVAATGETIGLRADTICVHGDTPNAVEIARAIGAALALANVRLQSLQT